MAKALLVLDFINDIVHSKGKLAGKGYSDFIKNHNTIQNLNSIISEFRNNKDKIIFVKIGFEKGYTNQPKGSLLFGKANEFGVLKLGMRGTEIFDEVDYNDDTTIIKHRVSAFFKTDLNAVLKKHNIDEIYLAGCSTDLVVESTARDAHDRDYSVNILENCCAAANISDQNNSISTMKKFSNIINIK